MGYKGIGTIHDIPVEIMQIIHVGRKLSARASGETTQNKIQVEGKTYEKIEIPDDIKHYRNPKNKEIGDALFRCGDRVFVIFPYGRPKNRKLRKEFLKHCRGKIFSELYRQADQLVKYAKKIASEVIVFGISMGGSRACYAGCLNQVPTVTINAVNPGPKALKQIRQETLDQYLINISVEGEICSPRNTSMAWQLLYKFFNNPLIRPPGLGREFDIPPSSKRLSARQKHRNGWPSQLCAQIFQQKKQNSKDIPIQSCLKTK